MTGQGGGQEAASIFHFSGRLFQIDSIKRAAYKFTDRFAFEFKLQGDEIICSATPLAEATREDLDRFKLAFQNEVLDQDLRSQIAAETSSVRNAILAHAFSNTGLSQVE